MGRTRFAVFVSLAVVGMFAASAPSAGGLSWFPAEEGKEAGNGTTSFWTGEIRLDEEVSVGPAERLRIGPGAWVRTASPDARLVVRGTLEVTGHLGWPTVVGVPIVLAGEDSRAEVRYTVLSSGGGDGGASVVVGPNASLVLRYSHVHAASDGVVVQALSGHPTPHRSVDIKRSLISGAGTGAGTETGTETDTGPATGTGASLGSGDSGGGSAGDGAGGPDEPGAGLRLEVLGNGTDERRTYHGHVWVAGNRFVGNDVGVAVDGWGLHGLRFQRNTFHDNRRGATVAEGALVLHEPTFRGNELAAEAHGSNATLHVRGADVSLSDVNIGNGSSAEVGGEVVRPNPLGLLAKISSASATILLALFGLGKWIGPRALVARLFYRPDDEGPLDNETRRKILDVLEENPGLHLRELGRAIGGYKKAVYHTPKLEDAGLLQSERDGGFKRFFPADPEEAEAPEPLCPAMETEAGGGREDVEARSTRAKLLELVREEPGIEQAEAAREVGCSRQLVSYHARRLEEEEVIEREDAGLRKRLYPLP